MLGVAHRGTNGLFFKNLLTLVPQTVSMPTSALCLRKSKGQIAGDKISTLSLPVVLEHNSVCTYIILTLES